MVAYYYYNNNITFCLSTVAVFQQQYKESKRQNKLHCPILLLLQMQLYQLTDGPYIANAFQFLPCKHSNFSSCQCAQSVCRGANFSHTNSWRSFKSFLEGTNNTTEIIYKASLIIITKLFLMVKDLYSTSNNQL